MISDDVSRELAALVSVVSLGMIAIVVNILRHSWNRFEHHFLRLSPSVRKATFRDVLFLHWPILLLLVVAYFGVRSPDYTPEIVILSLFGTIIILAIISIVLLIKRRIKKQTFIKSDTYTLCYYTALSYMVFSVVLNLFALGGVAPTMLLIKTGPFGPQNFEYAKWCLYIGIFIFSFGIVLFGFTLAFDRASNWKKQVAKENDN